MNLFIQTSDFIQILSRTNFKLILQTSFAKMNLVTREEFDNQTALLKKAQEKLLVLEKKINETWTKLQKAVKEKRANAVLTGRENLKLLLGECTYMANECKRWARLSKGARRNRR